MKRLAWYLFVLIVGSWLTGMPQADAVILINEVLFNPGGLDADGDGTASATGDEFVELVNTDGLPVSLNGWALNDALSTRHLFDSSATVPGLGFLVVFGSAASTGTLALNNTGDTVSLLDPSLIVRDQLLYSQSLAGASLTRAPDGSGGFADHQTVSSHAFSPGLTTAGAAHLAAPDAHPHSSVPEPASWMLFGMAGSLGMVRRAGGGMARLRRAAFGTRQ